MEAAWVISAFGLGWLVSRIGFPPLVGYLLAGVGLALTKHQSGPVTDELANVGVLILLFTVGLKLRWQSLVSKEVLGAGTIHYLLFGGLILALLAQRMPMQPAILIAAGLGFSSTVLAVKLLESRSELATFHGRVSVGILVLQDLIAMGFLASLGAKSPTPWALALPLLFIMRPLLFWVVDRSGHNELLLLLGMGLALGFGAIFKAVGISPELGALFAGVLLVGHPQATEMSKTLWGLKEFFLVAFFLKIGLMGLPKPEDWVWIGAMTVLIPLKAIFFFMLFALFKLRARTSFVSSVGLSSYSEFALILAAAAVSAGALEPRWGPILSMGVLISLVLAAPINRNVHTLYDRLEPLLERFQRRGIHADDEPAKLGRAQWAIVGMGRTGGAAYRTLEAAGNRVVGLDADLNKVQAHLQKRRRVVYGDAEDPDLWQHLEADHLEGVLLTLPDFESRLRAVQGLRGRGFKGVIGTTTHHLDEDDPILAAGADFIFHPYAAAGEKLAETALKRVESKA